MPGLSFLSKKSWHTSNISNQEKVWIAEQKAESESRRTKELLDQIKAEREGEEFDKLTGRKHDGVSGDRGTNWMYEGGKGGGDGPNYNEEEESRKNEAYLLGKEYVPDGGSKNIGDFAVASTMTGALEKASTYGATIGVGAVDAVGSGGGTTTSLRIMQQDSLPSDAATGKTSKTSIDDYENNHHEWNKEFHLRHEDPMFAVHQRRMEQEKDIQKKKRLMERVGLDVQILRRGDELSPTSNHLATGITVNRSSKVDDSGDERLRDCAKKGGRDSSHDCGAHRHHSSSRRSSRRHRNHDDRRMEKKRKRSNKRSKDDKRNHRRNRRRHHSRSMSPSSHSSDSSSSSYSSKSSTKSRSESSRPSYHRHRSHRSKHADRKPTRQYRDRSRDRCDHSFPSHNDNYHGERSRRADKERLRYNEGDERVARSSFDHRAEATTMETHSTSMEGNGKRGFGLVGTTLSADSDFQLQGKPDRPPLPDSNSYLGPDRQLLESKRAEVERMRQTRLNQARRR